MKGVLVVLDGVGDEACYALGQKTPLEAANTPNLDFFAKHGRVDYCNTVREDWVPESNEGVLGLLGYPPFEMARGPLEAIGMSVPFKSGDLAFRCNFATIDDLESRNVLDRRAGRTLTTEEARILVDAVNKEVKLPFKFVFYPGIQHRGVLVIKGGFSDNIKGVESRNGKLIFAEPFDESEDAKLSADMVNMFVRKSHEILDKHPVNMSRARKGLFSANAILCRGAGSERVRFKKIKGKWMAPGYMPLEIGIAKSVGMDVYKFNYPRLKSMDVYANLYSGLSLAIKYAVKMIWRNMKSYDYFYVHFKETDVPGHDNKPYDKVKMIELIDQRFFSFLRKYIGEARLIVTADHCTACRKKAHTSEPVPVLSYPFEGKKPEESRFTEANGLTGKRILGKRLLEERMFFK